MYLPESPSQVFSCEFYAVFKDTYSVEHLWRVASEYEWNNDLSAIDDVRLYGQFQYAWEGYEKSIRKTNVYRVVIGN